MKSQKKSRLKCVDAINKFRKDHGLTSLVVCSRIEEYTEIERKLSLDGAIKLQPLTPDQISSYMDQFGNHLASVRLLLDKDEVLQELAETPLMLNIMALAYKNVNADELLASQNIEGLRKHLFDTYIDRMFKRSTRSTNTFFTNQDTLHYLSWLARKMIQRNIIAYQIETMQPAWLENQPQRSLYRRFNRMVVELIGGLIYGLLVGLIGGLNGGFQPIIHHYCLRWTLARHGLLPDHLISFLAYSVDLIFLRRAGRSYIFVHRLLMEHFAEMQR